MQLKHIFKKWWFILSITINDQESIIILSTSVSLTLQNHFSTGSQLFFFVLDYAAKGTITQIPLLLLGDLSNVAW